MKKKAIICNTIIFLLEIIGFILYIRRMHTASLEYYTMDSNLLAMITSAIFIVYPHKNKTFIRDLRFITTSCLTVTFLVVIFVLCPMANFDYMTFLFGEEMIIFHTLCPIISIISYVLFEKKSNKRYLGFIFTVFYSLVLIILNLLNQINGPYPFLRIREQPVLMSIFWAIMIVGGSYIIGLGLNYWNNKNKRS